MALSDPLADLLTRIRNALKAEHKFVDISWSNMKSNVVNVLKKEGFIEDFLIRKDSAERGTIRILLKYKLGRKPVIKGLKRLSKPSLRRYVGYNNIPTFYGGMGLAIVSTSKGVMSGVEASKSQVGGELLCLVW